MEQKTFFWDNCAYPPNYLSWHQTPQERQHGTKQKTVFFWVSSLYPPTFLGTSKPRNVNMEQNIKKLEYFSWHQPSQKTWTLALATLGHTDVPWVASARVHVFWPQNEIPPEFQNGLLVPRKVGGYKLFTKKTVFCFVPC